MLNKAIPKIKLEVLAKRDGGAYGAYWVETEHKRWRLEGCEA